MERLGYRTNCDEGVLRLRGSCRSEVREIENKRGEKDISKWRTSLYGDLEGEKESIEKTNGWQSASSGGTAGTWVLRSKGPVAIPASFRICTPGND